MNTLTKEAHKSCMTRQCFACGNVIPERGGVYCAWLRILVCQGSCNQLVDSLVKDRSRSKGGRFRPRAQVLAMIREQRREASQ